MNRREVIEKLSAARRKVRCLTIHGRWNKLTRKLLAACDEKTAKDENTPEYWKRWDNFPIQKDKMNRRLYVRERFYRLIRKYILYDACV